MLKPMTAQHWLLIAGLAMLVSLGLQWPMAAVVCALATLVQAGLLLNLADLSGLRAWLLQPQLPRWLGHVPAPLAGGQAGAA